MVVQETSLHIYINTFYSSSRMCEMYNILNSSLSSDIYIVFHILNFFIYHSDSKRIFNRLHGLVHVRCFNFM